MAEDVETRVARHDEKIKDLENRAKERRAADEKIYLKLEEINKKLSDLKMETAVLWYKTGVWGIAGGAIPAIITLVVLIITGKI